MAVSAVAIYKGHPSDHMLRQGRQLVLPVYLLYDLLRQTETIYISMRVSLYLLYPLNNPGQKISEQVN
jgi:hypothetical protein